MLATFLIRIWVGLKSVFLIYLPDKIDVWGIISDTGLLSDFDLIDFVMK